MSTMNAVIGTSLLLVVYVYAIRWSDRAHREQERKRAEAMGRHPAGKGGRWSQ